MMFLALVTLVISSTSFAVQLRLQESLNSEASDGEGAESRFESEVFCSKAGNCTCLFEKYHIEVKCTSIGDKLDEIASELPQTATHL